MINQDINYELSDVLDEILLSGIEPSPASLIEWIRKYPQFRDEIMRFAVFEAVLEHSPEIELPAETPDRSAARSEMARSIVQKAIPVKSAETIESLAAEAKKQGLKFPHLARKVGLSIPLLANLEQRFVRFISIPEIIVDRLAGALAVSADAVKNYLQLPPEMTEQASFKAAHKPEQPVKQAEFFNLVEDDRMLTPEEKQALLKLKG